MSTLSLTTIGDCCMDIYPDLQKVFFGGTAFNVAYHAKRAGFNASIVSLVGQDSSGSLFLQKARGIGINTMFLHQIPGQTSSVQIPRDAEGKPVFSDWKLGVLQQLVLSPQHKLFLETQDTVRAILLKPFQKSFEQFCQMKLPNTFKVGDLAGDSIYSIDHDEIENYIRGLDMVIRSVGNPKVGNGLKPFPTELNHLRQLAQKYNKIILASLGAEGSIIFTKDYEYFEPVIPLKVTDTTGAGDAYIAYFLHAYLSTKDIQKSMKLATKAASKVVMQFGSNL